MKKVLCPQCNADSSDDHIIMHSGLNAEANGFVHLAWGTSSELRAQFTPDEMRQHALSLLEVAEAAEYDAMVARFFLSTGGDLQQASQFISALRQHRDLERL